MILSAACSRPDRPRLSVPVARDSAGIEIIDNPGADTALPEWTWDTRPALDIVGDTSNAGGDFPEAIDARRLSDGSFLLLISEAGDQPHFRVYDSTGKYLRRFGRRGRGPGELLGPTVVAMTEGDSGYVFDGALSRLTLFASNGLTPWMRSTRGKHVIGRFADGSWLAWGPPPGATLLSSGRSPVTFVRVDDTGRVLSQFGPFAGHEMSFLGDSGSVEPVFGLTASWTIGDSLFYVGTQDQWEIRGYDWGGNLRRIIRRNRARRPVTEEDRKTHKKIRIAHWTGRGPPTAKFIQRINNQPYADSFPAYSFLRTDREGNLWVGDPVTDADSLTLGYTVFDGRGRLKARAILPLAEAGYTLNRITDLGEGYFLGIFPDQDQVPHVRYHRLHTGLKIDSKPDTP